MQEHVRLRIRNSYTNRKRMQRRLEQWNDNDYVDEEIAPAKKKGKQSKKNKTARKKFYVADTFLEQHSDEIKSLHAAHEKPKAIAQYLRTKYLQGLRDDAVTAKQIDNFIQYRKRTKQWKTHPVTITNSNLRGDSDDCVFRLIIIVRDLFSGYADAKTIADEDGETYDSKLSDDVEDIWSEDSDHETDFAAKYCRFFAELQGMFVQLGPFFNVKAMNTACFVSLDWTENSKRKLFATTSSP